MIGGKGGVEKLGLLNGTDGRDGTRGVTIVRKEQTLEKSSGKVNKYGNGPLRGGETALSGEEVVSEAACGCKGVGSESCRRGAGDASGARLSKKRTVGVKMDWEPDGGALHERVRIERGKKNSFINFGRVGRQSREL